MNTLALDTSSNALVLGLQTGETRFDRFDIVDRSHSREILPAIYQLLADADLTIAELDLIVYGQGPGSFTGLRIAVGVVQGLAYGLNIPVVPVSTLACLAQAEYREFGDQKIVVALTARKQEVYFGMYEVDAGIARAVCDETVIDVDDLRPVTSDGWVGVGSGWNLKEKLEASLGTSIRNVRMEVWPRSVDLLDLGLARFSQGGIIPANEATPEYLREQVAQRANR
ncbi:MAG: tRNA (adenosine(37)-N6)-threonylcarbamoyltransferase complex dimerization subunit type 1 TsaB [Pseudomonadales bacterium]